MHTQGPYVHPLRAPSPSHGIGTITDEEMTQENDLGKKHASQVSESAGSPRTEQPRMQRLLQPERWSAGGANGENSAEDA